MYAGQFSKNSRCRRRRRSIRRRLAVRRRRSPPHAASSAGTTMPAAPSAPAGRAVGVGSSPRAGAIGGIGRRGSWLHRCWSLVVDAGRRARRTSRRCHESACRRACRCRGGRAGARAASRRARTALSGLPGERGRSAGMEERQVGVGDRRWRRPRSRRARCSDDPRRRALEDDVGDGALDGCRPSRPRRSRRRAARVAASPRPGRRSWRSDVGARPHGAARLSARRSCRRRRSP